MLRPMIILNGNVMTEILDYRLSLGESTFNIDFDFHLTVGDTIQIITNSMHTIIELTEISLDGCLYKTIVKWGNDIIPYITFRN
jgi:hypothetical protein